MPTAVITKSGQTQLLAGLTRHVVSGQDSFRLDATDGWSDIAEWNWTRSDGVTFRGANIQCTYPFAATFTLTLEVLDRFGQRNSTSTTITVAATPTFSAFTKYVDPARPNDLGDGNSPATAYKTLQKAIDTWTTFRGPSSTGFAWGEINLIRNGTFPFSGSGTIDFGPLYVTAYGTGFNPVISITTGGGFDIGRISHDNLYDNPVYFDGIDFTWTGENANNVLGMDHVASQVAHSTVTNGGIHFVGAGSTQKNVIQTKGYHYGTFPSGSFLNCEDCSYSASGHDGTFDHQVYASAGCSRVGFNRCTTDGAGANAAADGFKTSGVSKAYFADCRAKNSKVGFDIGGNTGEVCSDVVNDRPIVDTCTFQGFWPDNLARVSIRNPQSLGGLSSAVLELQNLDAGIQGINALDGSFSLFTGIFLRLNDNNFSNATVKNNAAVMNGAGNFFDIAAGADLTKLDSDWNVFWRIGGTPGADANFAVVAGVTKTFAQWQALGKDTNSKFLDPLFTSTTDLSLQAGSPCVDTGLSLGLISKDALGVVRPQGTAYDIGAFEKTQSLSVFIASPRMECGCGASPVIIPCPPGSNQISPFFKGLVFGYSTHDSPARNFERWEDVAANFACWGNGEPVSYVDEEGVTVGAHQGRVSSTKDGPDLPELASFLLTDWFTRFIPKATPFNTLLADDAHESKPATQGTGEERRYYYPPALRRALYHPDANERATGWAACKSINRETIERRPFFHNSKNGNQGGPTPFIVVPAGQKGGPPEEINHSVFDEFGNLRAWNAVGNTAPFAGDSWNAWDKQHNAGPTFHVAGAAGCREGLVNLWNNWRWVVTSFYPGSDGDGGKISGGGRGKQFDVPRSAGFGAFLGVYGYISGFEWADPQMIKYHCGGNSNGAGTGQNGGLGWKPSAYLEWLVKSCLGTAVADNGNVQLIPKGFIYWNIGCDNLGEPACLCDCSNPPIPGPGKSGCSGAAWIGPDGVNYGSQTIGIDLWHAGIECSGLMLVDSLNDFLIKTWGPGGGVLSAASASGLKSLLSYASGEAVFRCVNPTTYATAHYYTGHAHAPNESPTTPRGYDKAVAQAMLDDMFTCHADKAVDCEIRAINDGSGQWIVAEKVRDKVDLFYSLSMPWLMYVLGPNNPLVRKWLSSGLYIPPPGQDGTTGTQRDNYEFHARFTDFAWAMNETGSAVFITDSTMSAGCAVDGFQSHPVLVTSSTMAAGAAQDGNYKKGFLLVGPVMSAGAKALGQGGHGAILNAGVMAAAAQFDYTVQQGVVIGNSTMAAGAKMTTQPSGGGSSAIIPPPNRMRTGALFDFTLLRTGGSVTIPSRTLAAGAEFDGGKGVLWTQSDMACGAEFDGAVVADQTYVLLNPEMACGAALKKGRPVIGYKNRFDASGTAIVVEG